MYYEKVQSYSVFLELPLKSKPILPYYIYM